MKVLWFSCTTNNYLSFLAPLILCISLNFLLHSLSLVSSLLSITSHFSFYPSPLLIPSPLPPLTFSPQPYLLASSASVHFNCQLLKLMAHSLLGYSVGDCVWIKAHFISSENEQPTNQIALLCLQVASHATQWHLRDMRSLLSRGRAMVPAFSEWGVGGYASTRVFPLLFSVLMLISL